MDSTDAYETNAAAFLNARDSSSVGAIVVDKWARNLINGACVIELGCGGGYPITRVLHSAGLTLWAVDSSPTLVSAFQSRFPDIQVQCTRVQDTDFFDRKYNAAIAVGLVFLLPEQDQLQLISSVVRILRPGGRFLFSAPVEQGTWVDVNTGLECLSLGQNAYEAQIKKSGLRMVSRFVDVGNNNYYDTEKMS